MISEVPSQTSNKLEESALPLTERILEEEDWLDDGNDFGDLDGNDFGEEDIDLMEEDDLLGEDLQFEEQKQPSVDDVDGNRKNRGGSLDISTGSEQGKKSDLIGVAKDKSPKLRSPSDRVSGSSASTRKKRGSSSPAAFGVSLRQRKLKAGLGSPKPSFPGIGPIETSSKQPGPVSSANQRKDRAALAIPKSTNFKVASGKPPKAP
ncbi:hypothetical protein Rs2_23239 [Raphanus sativus]|nr:hypothetical protein Rs2_23239 [Raphanus sativus]